mgnify:CR=1 FL=1
MHYPYRQPHADRVKAKKMAVEYFFKTKEEFLSMIEKGELLEYAQYVENYYGTPKSI